MKKNVRLLFLLLIAFVFVTGCSNSDNNNELAKFCEDITNTSEKYKNSEIDRDELRTKFNQVNDECTSDFNEYRLCDEIEIFVQGLAIDGMFAMSEANVTGSLTSIILRCDAMLDQ